MASLFNQQISATYQGLLKTTSNGIITSSLAQITDGSGNGSQLYLSTASINFYNAYSFPNSDGSANQVLKTNGSGVLTWQNDSLSNTLNFLGGNSTTGSVLLSTQNFSVLGTANEIVTTASNQAITLSFPTAGVTLPNGSVATTQAASDDSTKVATTKYVTDAIGSISSGDVNVVGTPTVNQIAIWTNANTIKGMSALEIATDGKITLSQPNSAAFSTVSYNIGGGNIANVTGLNNTGFGLDNLSSLTTGTQNVAIGKSALGDNTEGLSNVSVGYLSLTSNTTGGSNIAIGVQSLQANTYASNNVSIGQSALILNVSGANNTAIGYLSLGANTANSNSTAVGYLSLRNSTGANNIAIGKDSGSAITTGSNNVIIGSNTGSTIATSDNNIIISDGSGNIRQYINSSAISLNVMSTIDVEGYVKMGRSDGNTSRYNQIKNKVSSTQASNFIKLSVHNGTENSTTDALTILGNGNVGIGVSPTAKLHIRGTSASTDSTLQIVGNGVSTLLLGQNARGGVIRGQGGSNELAFFVGGAGDTAAEIGTETMRIASGGNLTSLAQSTTAPSLTMGAAAGQIFKNEDLEFAFGLNNASPYNAWMQTRFNGNASRNFSINPLGGNVGIGTDSPSAKLQIHTTTNAGNAEVAAFLVNNSDSINTEVRLAFAANTNDIISTGRYSYISAKNTSGSNGQDLVFATNATGASATPKLTISSGGNVRINNSDAGNYRLKIAFAGDGEEGIGLQSTYSGAGNMLRFLNSAGSTVGIVSTTNTSTNYATSSDYRLKENVTPITDALSRVNKLKPSRFNFISESDKTVDGFLAHQVQDIIPEAISGEKDAVKEDGTPNYQGIDQSKIVPLLTAAIQEQQTIIEDLKLRIETLEG